MEGKERHHGKCLVLYIETKLGEDVDLPGDIDYKLWRRDRNHKMGGGVTVAVNKNIKS